MALASRNVWVSICTVRLHRFSRHLFSSIFLFCSVPFPFPLWRAATCHVAASYQRQWHFEAWLCSVHRHSLRLPIYGFLREDLKRESGIIFYTQLLVRLYVPFRTHNFCQISYGIFDSFSCIWLNLYIPLDIQIFVLPLEQNPHTDCADNWTHPTEWPITFLISHPFKLW